MLASTVQFSNNDQPPITPNQWFECTGAGTESKPYGRALRHPTTCPTPLPLPSFVPRPEEQYWKEKTVKSAE